MAGVKFHCAGCGEAFPWFIPRQQRISWSFLDGTRIRCSKCGQTSRIKVSIRNALWSWTLAVVLIFALLPSGAKHLGILIGRLLKPLRDVSPGLYGALGGALGGLVLGLVLGLTIGIGLRQGFEVVLDKERSGPISRAEKIQMWIEAIFPIAFALVVLVCFLVFRAVKEGRLGVGWYAYGLAICALTYGVMYLTRRFREKRRKNADKAQ